MFVWWTLWQADVDIWELESEYWFINAGAGYDDRQVSMAPSEQLLNNC